MRRLPERVLWCESDAAGTGLAVFVACRDGPGWQSAGVEFVCGGREVVSTGVFFDLRAALRSSRERRFRLWPWLLTRWRRSRAARPWRT
ncbi:MAG: hypothetical protein LBD77_02185 [Bifidobacteriaceae bacterium]|nr:hypothetical protein [Bifidobacteriaceae bacterium]